VKNFKRLADHGRLRLATNLLLPAPCTRSLCEIGCQLSVRLPTWISRSVSVPSAARGPAHIYSHFGWDVSSPRIWVSKSIHCTKSGEKPELGLLRDFHLPRFAIRIPLANVSNFFVHCSRASFLPFAACRPSANRVFREASKRELKTSEFALMIFS
jgi:hypothetical protein